MKEPGPRQWLRNPEPACGGYARGGGGWRNKRCKRQCSSAPIEPDGGKGAGWMNQAKGFEVLSPPVAEIDRAKKADETSNANGSEQCDD